jgi:hypothetical protein
MPSGEPPPVAAPVAGMDGLGDDGVVLAGSTPPVGEELGEALGEELGEVLGDALGEVVGAVLGEVLADVLGEVLGEGEGEPLPLPPQPVTSKSATVVNSPLDELLVSDGLVPSQLSNW